MRYLFLLHGDERAEAALTAEERREIVEGHISFAAMLREQGAFVAGEALAALGAKVKPQLLVGVLVFLLLRLFPFQRLVNLQQVVAVVVPVFRLRRVERGIHLNPHDIPQIASRVQRAVTKIARIVNHGGIPGGRLWPFGGEIVLPQTW